MDKLEFKPLLATLEDYDVYLFDLWGVIVEGTEVYHDAIDTINQISEQKKVFFVSNAPRPKLASFELLKSWGLKLAQDAVYTSGEIAREILIASKNRLKISSPIVYHLGADRNSEILEGLGLNITRDLSTANILLMTIYRDEGDNLYEFDQLLEDAANKNIICICANPDIMIPNQGANRYCSGYFAEKYEKFGGKVIYTGKPCIEIFDQVLNNIKAVQKNRILMIGDTLDTDIIGANNAGIHCALVMTGNARKFHFGIENFDQKLNRIYDAAIAANIIPNFITAFVK